MNPYELLGLKRTAKPSQIKVAFRRLAKTAHPDMQNGNRSAFERLQLAYDVLMDPERRAHYDATGEVRERKPDNSQAIAMSALAAAFTQVLNELVQAKKQPHQADLVVLMRKRLEIDIEERGKQRSVMKTACDKLTDLRDRFEVEDDKPNLMAQIVSGQITEIDRRMKQFDGADEAAKAALQILEAQTFDFEAPAPAVQFMMNGSATSSTATFS